MKYMGSKNRHAKDLVPLILRYHIEGNKYVEPFVGGANIIDKIPSHIHRIGYDIHPYLISMLQAASKGWLPPQAITEDQYTHIKNNKDSYPPELVGYTGFALSYGGKWWGGWCRDGAGLRDYVGEALRNAARQFPKLRGVEFKQGCVLDLSFCNSTIYCDPPYAATTGYSSTFDHNQFYDWCRKQRNNGNVVLVSEYDMPDDFECIWQKQVNSSLSKDTGGKKATEKLFILK